MTYSPLETSTTLNDHESLVFLINHVKASPGKVALVGFNEYSQQIMNLAPENVGYIFDPDQQKQGIRWRGLTVEPIQRKEDVALILITDFQYLYEVQGRIDAMYDGMRPILYPPRMHYKSTDFIVPEEQQSIYREIFADPKGCPPSMMAMEKIKLLIELVRAATKVSGDIVEMGVYQAAVLGT